MSRVFFAKYYEKGSTVMGGDQMSEALRLVGVDASSASVHELAGVRDSIIVFIKTSKLPDLVAAKRRGNLLVLDVQDTVCFKRHIKNRWLYDGLIFKNRRQLRDFGGARQLGAVIYHQWDPRYRRHSAGESILSPAYLGLERSLRSLWGRLPSTPCIDHDYFAQAPKFNCHISIRETRREFLYKPGTKVSTAAACGAGLITTRDESALEMLGPDYPFYTEPDLASVTAAIERAREALGGPAWRAALARLEAVRDATRIENIASILAGYLAAAPRMGVDAQALSFAEVEELAVGRVGLLAEMGPIRRELQRVGRSKGRGPVAPGRRVVVVPQVVVAMNLGCSADPDGRYHARLAVGNCAGSVASVESASGSA